MRARSAGLTGKMQRHAAILAMLGILLHALLPLVPMPLSGGTAVRAGVLAPQLTNRTVLLSDQFHSASAYRKIVVCTGSGLRQIVVDENGVPVDPQLPGNQGPDCPICLAMAGLVLAQPVTAEPVAVSVRTERFAKPQRYARFHDARTSAQGCRDPPYRA